MTEIELKTKIKDMNREQIINVLKTQKLSELFLQEHYNIISKMNLWNELSTYQMIPKRFLINYASKIKWDQINGNKLSCEFIDTIPNLNFKQKVLLKIKRDFNSFDDNQMEQIWLGMKYNELAIKNKKNKINITSYLYSHISAEKMKLIREQLIENSSQEKISIDDLINGNFKTEKINHRLKNKTKSKKLSNNKYGDVKLLENGIFEYPQKEHKSFGDNEFGDFIIEEMPKNKE